MHVADTLEPTRQRPLKSCIPYFGGKGRIAGEIWQRLGDTPNYVEPFFGSGAVLFARPHPPRIETINDKDHMVANFWRAVKFDPQAVAAHCDYPVIECDLEARHYWLVTEGRARVAKLAGNPKKFDAQVAGWWAWGISTWIGGGWCAGTGPHAWDDAAGAWVEARRDVDERGVEKRKPFLSGEHQGGVNAGVARKVPNMGWAANARAAGGIERKRPNIGGPRASAGGVQAGISRRRPHVSGEMQQGQGIHAGIRRQKPDVGGSEQVGRGVHASGLVILERLLDLADRLRRVRVCSQDWKRVITPAVTTTVGLTAVFLDPPYSEDADRKAGIYARDDLDVAREAAAWAIANGDNPELRIAFCGYEGEHDFPGSWECVAWKAGGGYGNRTTDGQGRVNAQRERVWFSPHCERAAQGRLFGASP